MAYTKPQVIAQNTSEGSYAAGCPTYNDHNGGPGQNPSHLNCKKCERTA